MYRLCACMRVDPLKARPSLSEAGSLGVQWDSSYALQVLFSILHPGHQPVIRAWQCVVRVFYSTYPYQPTLLAYYCASDLSTSCCATNHVGLTRPFLIVASTPNPVWSLLVV